MRRWRRSVGRQHRPERVCAWHHSAVGTLARGRDAGTVEGIEALQLLGSAMVNGSVDGKGILQSPGISPRSIEQALEAASQAIKASMWPDFVFMFKIVFVLPFQTLWVTPKTIAQVVEGATRLPPPRRWLFRDSRDQALAEFGACLSANARDLIENPNDVAAPAREVLVSRVTGMPELNDYCDERFIEVLVSQIGQRINGLPRARRAGGYASGAWVGWHFSHL